MRSGQKLAERLKQLTSLASSSSCETNFNQTPSLTELTITYHSQSALIKYWAFEPALPGDKGKSKDKNHDATLPNPEASLKSARSVDVSKDGSDKSAVPGVPAPRVDTVDTVQSEENEEVAPKKLIPVLFFDEAHRLPLLIQDRKAMKCILDAMLVLTKQVSFQKIPAFQPSQPDRLSHAYRQDRLCHVVAATSDPFYMHWLRQMNIMQHCKIQTIGDVSKIEAEAFFKDKLLPDVPEKLRSGFNFEDVYRVFGGKLAHLSDYAADYVNADGRLERKSPILATTQPQSRLTHAQCTCLIQPKRRLIMPKPMPS